MFGYLFLGVSAVLVPLYISRRPAEFRIQRSVTIDAAPEVIFSRIVDLKQWSEWSPWEKLDPDMKKSYSGAALGKGAIYEWSGDKKVGQGRMEIIDVRDNEQITIDLQFIAPFRALNTTVFKLTREPSSVKVSWAMSGTNTFMSKAFSLVMNMDKLVGSQFEKGLSDLKRLSEQQATA